MTNTPLGNEIDRLNAENAAMISQLKEMYEYGQVTRGSLQHQIALTKQCEADAQELWGALDFYAGYGNITVEKHRAKYGSKI